MADGVYRLLGKHKDILARYSEAQREVIKEYFEILKCTRSSGIISPWVLEKEVEFWAKFAPEVVIEALKTHIERHTDKKEQYTHGIIRNMAKARIKGEPRITGKSAKRSRFANFKGREIDYEAMEYIERLENRGALTPEKRAELKKDPKYASYL